MRSLFASILMIAGAAMLPSLQLPVSRVVHVSVTDPLNRFVTGLDQQNFEIIENGSRRPIADFLATESPIAVELVSEAPLATLSSLFGTEDELIQTQSLADAVIRLGGRRAREKF